MFYFALHYICVCLYYAIMHKGLVLNPNKIMISDCSLTFLLLFNYIPLIYVFITPPFSVFSVFLAPPLLVYYS